MKTLLTIILFAPLAFGANAFVNAAANHGDSGADCVITLSGVSIGDFLFVASTCYNADCSGASTPSDGVNSYTVLQPSTYNTHSQYFGSWTAISASNGTLTITTANPNSGNTVCSAADFTVDNSTPNLGVYADWTGTNQNWDSGPTNVGTGALRIGWFGQGNRILGPWTAGTGWTLAAGAYAANTCAFNTCLAIDIEYDLNAAGGNQDATAMLASPAGDNGFIVEHWIGTFAGHKVIDAQ